MPHELYRQAQDMPQQIPVFPLSGATLLPRSHLPLNIFEPRYLEMINDAIAGNRIIGMIQPLIDQNENFGRSTDPAPEVQKIGGAGKIISFSESDDQHLSITLAGISRFEVKQELETDMLYRMFDVDYEPFAKDFIPAYGEEFVDREKFLSTFQKYLDTHNLEADWKAIEHSPTESLVNTLSMISPYGLQEKQALLEAKDLKTRSEILMTLTEMSLAEGPDTDKPLQ